MQSLRWPLRRGEARAYNNRSMSAPHTPGSHSATVTLCCSCDPRVVWCPVDICIAHCGTLSLHRAVGSEHYHTRDHQPSIPTRIALPDAGPMPVFVDDGSL